MGTDADFIAYLTEQLSSLKEISLRKMFGEYAVYLDGKIVALVCDNRLFVKPTDEGKAILGRPPLAAPYPGAKPCFVVEGGIDDAEMLARLMRVTAKALPAPKLKKAPAAKKGGTRARATPKKA